MLLALEQHVAGLIADPNRACWQISKACSVLLALLLLNSLTVLNSSVPPIPILTLFIRQWVAVALQLAQAFTTHCMAKVIGLRASKGKANAQPSNLYQALAGIHT